MNTETTTDKTTLRATSRKDIKAYKHFLKTDAVAEIIRQRDEAREELAGIEDKMRVELGGHPNSKLWGEAGLIAATMRCVDALGEVTEQRDEARERIKNNPWCEACLETDCCVSGDGTCAMIRKYLSAKSAVVKSAALQSLTPKQP